VSRRCFSSASETLATYLQNEIDEENSLGDYQFNAANANAILQEANDAFRLDEKETTDQLIVVRSNEAVISFNTSDESDSSCEISILQAGSSKELVFDCSSDEDDMYIDDIYIPSGKNSDDVEYSPKFDELDDNLQAAFRDFVVSKGISHDLMLACKKLQEAKENDMYRKWLEDVQSFVK